MTQDDVLFGYRLQLFALASERGVSEACRLMGVNRSTYYRWKHEVECLGNRLARARLSGVIVFLRRRDRGEGVAGCGGLHIAHPGRTGVDGRVHTWTAGSTVIGAIDKCRLFRHVA